jgi:hypothetical protein
MGELYVVPYQIYNEFEKKDKEIEENQVVSL